MLLPVLSGCQTYVDRFVERTDKAPDMMADRRTEMTASLRSLEVSRPESPERCFEVLKLRCPVLNSQCFDVQLVPTLRVIGCFDVELEEGR